MGKKTFEEVNGFAPEDRIDGVAKVTGAGNYAAEFELPQMLHGVLVGSKTASGTIMDLDVSAAKKAAGVVDVLSHKNRPALPGFANAEEALKNRMGLPIFHTNKIYFFNQPIALVVAETIEQATYAASLVKAIYNKTSFTVNFEKELSAAEIKDDANERGNMDNWKNATHKHTAEYLIPMEVHSPMETHATIAHWTDETHLTLYDKNQGVNRVQASFAQVYNLPAENFRVLSQFVGGGFGSGLRVWPHSYAASMAATATKRPVKVVLTRPQMFMMAGYRPEAWQKIHIGANANGKFSGVRHDAKGATSQYENFTENIVGMTKLLYDFPNVKTSYSTIKLNLSTPVWMRAPGEATGSFALESAIDELSYTAGIDPVELRLKNIPEQDPEKKLPWSSNFFGECLTVGAEKFGWNKRKQQPKQITDGDWYIGYGVAGGTWASGRNRATVNVNLSADGSLHIRNAVTDIGTGTGIAIVNIAAERTGIKHNKIKFSYGTSDEPAAPSQGGSVALSTVGGALADAIDSLKKKLVTMVAAEDASLGNTVPNDVLLDGEEIQIKNTSKKISLSELLKKNNVTEVEAEENSTGGEERKKYSFNSFAAHFCEVKVHRLTGKVKVTRYVSVVDAGKIIAEKPARNQVSGAIAGGIGMALMEAQAVDTKLGTLVGNDFAGYHFPVNADVPISDCYFINKPDPYSNKMGSKGIGEVGIIGTGAAIANAIYNACGIRVRELPISPDKLIGR